MRIGTIVAAALVVLALMTGQAHSEEFYVTAGFGQSRLQNLAKNGHWYQAGYAYSHDERANAWKLGVGWRWKPWLALEADYRDLGEYNAAARFVSDANYNPKTHNCNHPCETTSTGWQHGEVRGLGLSAVVKPGESAFVRLGAFVHKTKFRSYIVHGWDDPYSKDFTYVTPYDHNWHRISVRPLVGVGFDWKALSVEANAYPRIGTEHTAYRDVYSVMLNFRF